ncbi:MAG: threonine ammonia-lyase [Deltaproteobacteria bacterium]|nr:threonine ammonia-lyase [Deltaproteobacteria bacterium]
MSVSLKAIEEAYQKIRDNNRRTPLFRSFNFEKRVGSKHPIYFKVESLQYTGSFKSRGALNKLLNVLDSAKKNGVITASAGNHAQGVAFHAQRLGINAKIVMPVMTPFVKVNSTKQWGPEIVLFGESYQEAYEKALEIQKQEKREYIHAFDDEAIINGQGSIALEILEDCPQAEVFISPIGGGGLIAGCAQYFKEKKSSVKVVGVQADGCSTFLPSLKAGSPVTLSKVNTIAEGMSPKRMGDLTFKICRELVKETQLVSDEEIAEGLLWLLENERLFVEGCGGATVAAVMKNPALISGPTVILLSGGNLDVNLLARIIERGLVKTGRLVMLDVVIPDVPGSLHRLIETFAEQKASIVQISHERVFGEASLKEVNTRITLETQGADHVERVKKSLHDHGWEFKFLG